MGVGPSPWLVAGSGDSLLPPAPAVDCVGRWLDAWLLVEKISHCCCWLGGWLGGWRLVDPARHRRRSSPISCARQA